MVDLERLFRRIVLNLAAKDPAGLRRPLTLAEIRDSIVPYRANRRALEIESSEEYELALLRLCAGEADLARSEPLQVQTQFAEELAGPHPDLAVLYQHDKTSVHLNPAAVKRVLNPQPDLRYAPVQSVITPEQKAPRKRARPKPESRSSEAPLLTCTRCGGTLPTGRAVKFCPQCGQNLVRRHCLECNTEVENTWRHCVECGAGVSS